MSDSLWKQEFEDMRAMKEALAAELEQAKARVIELSDMKPQTLKQRVQALEAALRDMVDRWEPDGGSDKRMWDRARELLGYESETPAEPVDLMISPQPTWIESSGRWKYPLNPPHDNDGKCPAVYTASREWWEYLPAGAFPPGCNMAAQKPDGRWFWCFANDRGVAK